ncbi:MAG: hypothetical protein ACXIVG_05775 [Pararhodobacter sp.]
MNLVRSFAAVIGTLGVALAAGSLFQQATQGQEPARAATESGMATASLASPVTDAALPAATTPPEPAMPALAAPSRTGAIGAASLGTGAFGPVAPLTEAPATATIPHEETLPETAPGPASPEFASQDSLAPLPAFDTSGSRLPRTPPGTGDAARETSDPVTAPTDTDTAVTADVPLLAEPDPCAVWLVVTPADAAMLDTSVYAPCHAGARADFDHAGLHFSVPVGDDGQIQLMIPALRVDARVTLTLPDGSTAEDAVAVPDMADHDRLVLGWTGDAILSLHAHADGAPFGTEGHIHAGFTGAPGQAPYGFLKILGDAGMENPAQAQVYTFPSGMRAGSGRVEIGAEAVVNAQSCGTEISAQTLLSHGGEAGAGRRVTFALPTCDGIDGFLSIDGLIAPTADGLAQAG